MFGTFGNKRPMGYDEGDDPWNNSDNMGGAGDSARERKRKRRSRWNVESDEKTVIPGMPTMIPADLSESQQRQYVVHLQIEEITRKLRSGDLGIPANPEQRSPSPEPIYNNEGKRLNTREYRTRKKLEEDRHKFIQEALKLNSDFKPPSDYKPPVVRVSDKVMIPQDDHPDINFVGLLIGPRGNTLKTLEKDTGAKIIIRGKGSVKDGKIGRKDGQPMPGEDEPLHAYVTANNPENVQKAVKKIKEIIKQGIEVPEGQNDLRRQQLRELALLNGTLRENDGLQKLRQIAESQTIVTNTIVCTLCGGTGHIAQDCKQRRPGDSFRMQQMQNPADRAKMDSEYMSLMAELGEGPPPPKSEQNHPNGQNTFGRPLLSNPPPNPMGMNQPWQMPGGPRPLMGGGGRDNQLPMLGGRDNQLPMLGGRDNQHSMLGGRDNQPSMLGGHGQQNNGGPQGMMGQRMPMPLMATPMQPPNNGLLPPPNSNQQHPHQQQQQQQQQQPPPLIPGLTSQQPPQQGGSMLRPWQMNQQQQVPQSAPQSLAGQMSQAPSLMSIPTSINNPMGMGAPPPPPPTSQNQQQPPPWMQQGQHPQGHYGMQQQQQHGAPHGMQQQQQHGAPHGMQQQQQQQHAPPAPPTSAPAPWQQQQQQHQAPPPPPNSMAPWQPPPPPSLMSMPLSGQPQQPPPPPSLLSMPSPVQPPSLMSSSVPPPPPQGGSQYNSYAPPPPPPMGFGNQRMQGMNQMMMGGPPPPPPPN